MPLWLQIQNFINYLLLLLTIFAIYEIDENLYANHLFMIKIAFLALIAKAIMYHFPLNPITGSLSRRDKSRFHGILQLIGGSMILLGQIQSNEDFFFPILGALPA